MEVSETEHMQMEVNNGVLTDVDVQMDKHKRVVKLTPKAFAEKVERLQYDRKSVLTKAASLRNKVQGLMQQKCIKEVQVVFVDLLNVCDEAKGIHCSLMGMLPESEQEKHDIWFKAKMIVNNEFISEVKIWISCQENIEIATNEVMNDEFDDVNPDDSISNLGSKHSSKASTCKSVFSARVMAEANKAALLARMAALEERHALEEQEQMIRRKKEQFELKIMLAESTAKLAVLQVPENYSVSQVSHIRTSQLGKEEEKASSATLNPKAKEFEPVVRSKLANQILTVNPPLTSFVPCQEIHQQPLQTSQQTLGATSIQTSRPLASDRNFQHISIQNSGPLASDGSSRSQAGNQYGDIVSIMQKQNEITAALVQQQCISLLPPRNIPLFDGDPLQYVSFIRAFQKGVEEKASHSDCLYYLEQFTRGQPRELVRSCLHMTPDFGYAKAKQLLQEHFGNKYRIANAYLEKAIAWRPIKGEDANALQSYALFLRGCCNVTEELEYLKELDMPSNLRAILSKLPYKLRERWRTVAHNILETTKCRASFKNLVEFAERQAGILMDPVFGEIRDLPVNIRPVNHLKLRQESRVKGNIFATSVSPVESEETFRHIRTELLPTNAKMIPTCVYCAKHHVLENCMQFQGKKHREKMDFLKEKELCFGCLSAGHMSCSCGKRLTCKICSRPHPTVLHIERNAVRSDTRKFSGSTETCGQTGAGEDRCILSILPVQVKASKGDQIIQTYAFLDPGSSATFCTESLMQRLNLSGRRTRFLLQTMGQEKVVPAYVLSGLEVSSLDGKIFYQLPQMLTQKQMPVSSNNIVSKGDLSKWPYLANVEVPHIMANVDLLIGSNAPKMLEPWEVINSQGNGPYAIRTALGWVINGSLHASSLEAEDCSAVVNRISVCRLEEMLSKQYNHDFNEQAAEELEWSREDIRFLEIAESSATFKDNHYTLKLPFKRENVYLPNNFSVAKQRMLGLKRRFQRDEQFHQEYVTFVNDMINKGYAEQVPFQQMKGESGKVWYIPHHGVRHPRKRNLRVVFDCGAVFKGTSLNQVLLQGPNLTNTLLGVLLRFRQELVAVMGDIQAMFHQVRVAEEDQDFLRFLWWQNGDFTKEMSVFRMTVHLFGAVSSPSCAAFALRKTADDHQSEFREEVVTTLKENFYVDDCLKSVASEEKAVCLVKDLSMLCHRGGFTLTKWISNRRTVLQTFPEEHRAKEWKELDLDRDSLPVERALGLLWCAETDSFKFKMEIQETSCTRRGMLSVSSSVYDPLGFLAPVVLPAKIMLQELCRRKLGWDENVPKDIARHWVQWLKELNELSEFKVKRCIRPGSFNRHAQLHHFSDAGLQGYGTVTYLRIENINGDIYVAFLMGKARVTPLKAVTIPRLELTAALLAVRVDLMLKKELRLQLQDSVFWTDSTSVLRYVMNEDKRFYTFVANRVSIIREVTKTSQWRYVSSKENPADDASRGRRAGEFIRNNLWIEGPKFLWKSREEWPNNILLTAVGVDDPEVKKEAVVNALNTQGSRNGTDRLMAYYSNWRKLQVAVAWFLKLKTMLLRRIHKRMDADIADTNKQNALIQANHVVENTTGGQTLSAEDLMEAELAIICYCQQQRFPEEIAAMSSGKDLVSKQSIIYRLDPWLDNGLLRVGGRLTRGSLPEEMKYPLLLSKDQHVATLILKDLHEQLGHSGRNHMLSTLRRRYWITSATSAVRKIIAECCFCRKYNGKRMEQKMADLPKERILPDHPPFTNTGVDYFGPIEVKRGRGTVKRYGVIFTCLASRAVHLELANSLDTDACINALRRFISRRGQVEHLLSDNGTNFIGAERELREALATLNQTKIRAVLCQKGIKWTFNPPAGSHFGGVWERLIRMLRKILTAVLQQQKLDDDGFHTVLCEAEAILNDRPITKLSDDPMDLEVLTPNHILLLKGKPCLSPGLFEEHDLFIKRRWKQVQYISDLFWKRWVKEYLPLLQERQKWNTTKNSLKPGDVVVIMDPTAPRGSWPLGRVLETFPDKKGLVRFVRLQTKTSILDRPVAKLCLLHESEG